MATPTTRVTVFASLSYYFVLDNPPQHCHRGQQQQQHQQLQQLDFLLTDVSTPTDKPSDH